MTSRQIYLLSPKCLSPETIAVAFAKTSRVPDSFQDIASELSEETSSKFHEKWVVGYGHSSVAEHAVLHLALENVSRLAIECIESNRLASYTEKSTRYQKWGKDDFVIPPELDGHPLREEYIQTIQKLFAAYEDSLIPVRKVVEEQFPRRENEDDEAWDRRLRSRYVDATRFLLPAAAVANVGMTANARVLENAVRKMLSHPLAEVREIGLQVREVSQSEVPTLVKYADTVPYLVESSQALEGLDLESKDDPGANDWCTLIDYDRDGEEKVLAAALYRFGDQAYDQVLQSVRDSSAADRQELAEALLGKLGPHDVPLRELEYSHYTFDLVMDQGAYAEFKRHRMMSQTPQGLTCRLGYATPRLITTAGFGSAYGTAMNAAAETYEKLAGWNAQVAAYVVPNGYNRRVLAQFNLREAYHFCQLRAASNAHFSIRRVAQQVADEIRAVHPLLSKFMKLYEETGEQIEREHFSGVS